MVVKVKKKLALVAVSEQLPVMGAADVSSN